VSPAERARYVVTIDRMDDKPWRRQHICAVAVSDNTDHWMRRVVDLMKRMRSELAWVPVARGLRDQRLHYRYRWT